MILNNIEYKEGYTVYFAKERFTGKKRRFALPEKVKNEEFSIFLFVHGSRKYGNYYTKKIFEENFIPLPPKGEADAWRRRLNNVVKALEKSGLWSDLLVQFKNLQKVDFEQWQKLKDAYYSDSYPYPNRKALTETIYNVYPFMTYEKNGERLIDTFYFEPLADCITKSMYFGSSNAQQKENIAQALQEKRSTSVFERVNYDVRFEYDSGNGKAWYSEEYKGCGNGHYYIALNHSTALYYEDD